MPPEPDDIHIRRARVEDGPHLAALARASGELDHNSTYLYVIMCRDFAETCWVACRRRDAHPVGFVMGYRPPGRPESAFVWQVAVAPAARGQGLAGRLLDAFVRGVDARMLEATVTPSNTASRRLFRAFAARHDAPLSVDPDLPADLFPGPHEREDRFSIGPIRSHR